MTNLETAFHEALQSRPELRHEAQPFLGIDWEEKDGGIERRNGDAVLRVEPGAIVIRNDRWGSRKRVEL